VQLSKQLIVGCFGMGVFVCLLPLGTTVAPAIPGEVQTTASISNHKTTALAGESADLPYSNAYNWSTVCRSSGQWRPLRGWLVSEGLPPSHPAIGGGRGGL
jgi:hypothetical protein